MVSNPGFQGHDILQRQISRKWFKIELYLQWRTDMNRKWSTEWFHFNDIEWHLTQISRAHHYSTLSIWETIQDRQTHSCYRPLIESDMCLLNSAVSNLDWPSRLCQLFLSENKCSLLLQSLIESSGDLTKANTVDVRNVSSPQWKTTLWIYGCGGGLLVASINGPHSFLLLFVYRVSGDG